MTLFQGALSAIKATIQRGQLKHPANNWRNRPVSYQIERARTHLIRLMRASLQSRTRSMPTHGTRPLMALEVAARDTR
jgi:hypothetical protein